MTQPLFFLLPALRCCDARGRQPAGPHWVMAAKCALIVDDSRTALRALGDVLSANQLRVETAASAEEALEYLSRNRPDVIFMDHLMPGMDGFQAVRAIKTNPATATIPIMMYTSQAGELYVGQARALGAVGVLPKQVKPVEVSDVLRSLHLVGGAETQAPPLMPPAESPPRLQAPPPAGPVDAPLLDTGARVELECWLHGVLDDHRRSIHHEMDACMARVLRERPPQPPAPARSPALRVLLGALLVLNLVALVGLVFRREADAESRWRTAVEQNAGVLAALNSRNEARPLAAGDDRARPAATEPTARRLSGFVAALEWGVNQSAAYPPGAEPFDGTRLQTLQGLLERLPALGFAGTVRLDSHVGDFCYVAGAGRYACAGAGRAPGGALRAHRAARPTRPGSCPRESRLPLRTSWRAMRTLPCASSWCPMAMRCPRCRTRPIHRA